MCYSAGLCGSCFREMRCAGYLDLGWRCLCYVGNSLAVTGPEDVALGRWGNRDNLGDKASCSGQDAWLHFFLLLSLVIFLLQWTKISHSSYFWLITLLELWQYRFFSKHLLSLLLGNCQVWDCWVVQYMVHLCNKLPDCFSKWLYVPYCFPTSGVCPGCFASSLDSVRVFVLLDLTAYSLFFFFIFHFNRLVVVSSLVLICISLVTNNVEHLFCVFLWHLDTLFSLKCSTLKCFASFLKIGSRVSLLRLEHVHSVFYGYKSCIRVCGL